MRKDLDIDEGKYLLHPAFPPHYLQVLIVTNSQFAEHTPLGEDEYPSPEYERGCRRTIQIDEEAYCIDALELRPEHLSNEPYLRQAIGITEAAIVMYDVTARDTFDIVAPVVDVIRDALGPREYGLALVGNKTDCNETGAGARQVSWAEGHRLAAGLRIRCSFLETSAKRGDDVDRIFPQLGRDVLKIRWLARQRREDEVRFAVVEDDDADGDIIRVPVKRRARWRSWARPWFHRRMDGRKFSIT